MAWCGLGEEGVGERGQTDERDLGSRITMGTTGLGGVRGARGLWFGAGNLGLG